MFLVEWPSVITGRFDARHLRLPSRVLVTAMQGHQRYFPLRDRSGDLLPVFLAVSNGDPDHADVITRGNEDVLDARLQDAEFSFDRDLEAGLEALDARLDAIVFHKRLGTMAQKRDRLVAGVRALADAVGADAATPRGRRAGRPPGEGRPGRGARGRVLRAGGLRRRRVRPPRGRADEVATAVEEHYLPEGPDSPMPSSEVGALVAAAEKIDNLVGAFAVDEAPDRLEGPLRPAARRDRPGADRVRPRLGLRPGADLLGPPTSGCASRAPTWRTTRRAPPPRSMPFLFERLGYLLAAEGVGAEAVHAAARGVRTARRRSPRWARDDRGGAGHAGVGRGVDGRHPPAAHRAQGPGRG